MKYTLVIKGRLPGLNEIITANRSSKFEAAKQKKDVEGMILWYIREQLKGVNIERPVKLTHFFYEPNKRRDKDNISAAKKFIWDALVRSGVLKNDGWDEIHDFRDYVLLDQVEPRVVVEIEEV